MSVYEFDVLVIGCGISGLTSAAKLAETGMKVGILTRDEDPKVSNTLYAQGGIIYPHKSDTDLLGDIERASSFTANMNAAKILKERSGKILEEIL